MIAINSYTTVKCRDQVPHDVFAEYWRDVHGPLCARLPGLGHYVQYHFDRVQDAHLWPLGDGILEIPDYELDGMVEIGFAQQADQQTFQAASPLLFNDEQNMFSETLAYDLPNGSCALKNTLADDLHNGPDRLDRLQLHMHPRHDLEDLNGYLMNQLGPWLASTRPHQPWYIALIRSVSGCRWSRSSSLRPWSGAGSLPASRSRRHTRNSRSTSPISKPSR